MRGVPAEGSRCGTAALKRIAAAITLLALWTHPAAAEVVVAQVSPFTGPLGATGQAHFDGARAALDHINAQGGINGAPVRIVKEDDLYQPEKTVALLHHVASRDKPVAFINLFGSIQATTLLQKGTLEQLRIPIVGVSPSPDALHKPGSRWLFNVQASDRQQLRKIVNHLATLGHTRVAIAFQDNPFGTEALAHLREMASDSKIEVVGVHKVPLGAEDLREAGAALKTRSPQAYILALAPNSAASFVRDARRAGDATSIYAMSYVSTASIIEKASLAHATGVALAQITPNTFSSNTALVREFRAAMSRYAPQAEAGPRQLMGYITARVVAEAIGRAGPSPTPEKVRAALASQKADFGGYRIDFARSTSGSTYVDIGVIGRDGRLLY